MEFCVVRGWEERRRRGERRREMEETEGEREGKGGIGGNAVRKWREERKGEKKYGKEGEIILQLLLLLLLTAARPPSVHGSSG